MNTRKICAGIGAIALIGGLAACGTAAGPSSPPNTPAPSSSPVGVEQTLAANITNMTTSEFSETGYGNGPGNAQAIATGSVSGVVNTCGIDNICSDFNNTPEPVSDWQNTGTFTLAIGELSLSDGTQHQAVIAWAPDTNTTSFGELNAASLGLVIWPWRPRGRCGESTRLQIPEEELCSQRGFSSPPGLWP